MQKLQVYLANLSVLNIKLHNLHWNVVGKNFMQVHTFTQGLYEALFIEFDDVAELLKMREVMPASSLADYLKLSTIKELESKQFSEDEVITFIKKDLAEMIELAKAIRKDADEADDNTMVAAFDTIIANHHKNLWFIKSMLA